MAKNIQSTNQVEIERMNKTIGVEIEFFGATREKVAEALKRNGIRVEIEGWNNRKTFNGKWKITTDGSVTNTGTGLRQGLELVSPPLAMEDMEDQLKKVTEALDEVGAKVDRSCGLHVHHLVDDLNVNQIKNIYRIYNKHQDSIDEFMPKSRRGRQSFLGHMTDDEMQYIENAESIEQLQRGLPRYRNINFQSYVKYGTIEFRQHSGTTDFEKIINWVKITSKIVETAKNKKSIRPRGAKANITMALNKEIGTYNSVQGGYIRDRKKALRKLYKIA